MTGPGAARGDGSAEHGGNRHGSHPLAATSAHPTVRAATPRWRILAIVGCSWLQAIATTWVFILVGRAADGSWNPPLACAAVALAALMAGAETFLTGRTRALTARRLRRSLVATIFRQGPVRSEGKSGDLLSLATSAVDKATEYRAGFLGPIVGSMTTPLVVLVVLAAAVDWVTAAAVLVLVLGVPFLVAAFHKIVRPISGRYHRTQGALTRGFLEAIQALDTLVLNRAAAHVADDLAARGEEHRVSLMRMLAVNQLLILVVDAAFSLAVIAATAGVAAVRVESGAISLGGAVAFVLASLVLTGPVDVMGQFFYIGIGGRGAVRGLSEFFSQRDHEASVIAASPGTGIVVDSVTGGWPGAEPTVRDFSLTVAPGERVALVAPSGAGKSTLAAMVLGYLNPQSGSISVGGEIAAVEQRTFLFNDTVAYNLRVARPDASDEELHRALGIAGLDSELDLNDACGEHGALLSGGQAQRLAVARAWLTKADCLIFDEPTSQVDLAGEKRLVEALDQLAADRAVLMIAHRPDAIFTADRVEKLR